MKIDSYWLREGQVLGLQFLIDRRPQIAYWRVIGREIADYRYAFASVATNVGTGWIDLQTAQNVSILEPRQITIINHMFIGILHSDCIIFLQYPANVDHNALTGNRAVDSTGTGGIWGFESPYQQPSPKTELFVVNKLRPQLQAFNANGNTLTPRIKLYAMQYLVAGPFVANDKEIGGEDRVRSMIESGDARMSTIFGINQQEAPDWVSQVIRPKLQVAPPQPAGAYSLRGA